MAPNRKKEKEVTLESDDEETVAQHIAKRTRQSYEIPAGTSEATSVHKLVYYVNARWFTSLEQIKWYERYFDRCTIIQPWFVHEYDFEYDECNLQPMKTLTELGLMEFCYMSGEYYEDLVKVFYSNLEWDEYDEVLRSEVKGTKIVLNMDEWNKLTMLPFQGAYFVRAENVFEEEYSKDKAKAEILLPGFDSKKPVSPVWMKFEYRLLHYTLVRCIIPRGNNHYNILDSDYLTLWAMINRKEVNWSRCILLHMVDVMRKVKKGIEEEFVKKASMLPYALLISKILRHFKVPLSGERKMESSSETCIDGEFVKSKGWKYTERSGWKPSGRGKGKEEDGSTVAEKPASHSEIPPYLQLFMDEVRHHMIRANAHQVTVEDGLTELKSKLELISKDLEHVKHDVKDLTEAQGYFNNEDFT